jgi:butyryl-CoA dehydrogenase
LLGRKVTLKNGKVLEWLGAEIQQTIAAASKHEALQPYAEQLTMNLGLVQQTLGAMMPMAQKGDFERFLADATSFMDFFGTIIIGWQWLKMATSASELMANGTGEQPKDFYEAKVHTMKFFYKYEMARTKGLSKILIDQLDLTVDMELSYLD